jgi:hypothetical protein
VAHTLAGFAQNLGKRQFDWLTACQETPALPARQGCKQLIVSRDRFGNWQVNSPCCLKTR